MQDPVPTDPAPRELTLPDQSQMVASLRAAMQAAQPGMEVSLIETHISFVLLTPQFTFKFKKALDLGFLDYSTLARRRGCCAEELRLNRRSAPDLYLDVVSVRGTPAAPTLEGQGPVIDVAVRMRTFAQEDLWDHLAQRGALGPAHIDALVATLARLHAEAAVAPADGRLGSPAQVREPMLDNLRVLGDLLQTATERCRLERLRAWEPPAFDALAAVFRWRQQDGWIRECHGDLHLGNVTQVDGRTTVFDCIEFNDDFRWIDTISDIGFLAMDLHVHGLTALANRFVNACLEASGDYAGMRVLRYYVVHRALVRAKVKALRDAQQPPAQGSDRVARHLAMAESFCRASVAPVLMITHGLSGSGKTTLTQDLLERVGAVRIRSDVERKRLFGLPANARTAAEGSGMLYGAAAGEATYARLFELAAPVLAGGFCAVLDATFLQRQQRDAARRFAAEQGVRLIILDFDVDPATLRERVRQRRARGADASDADLPVLEAQLRSAEPLAADEAAEVLSCVPMVATGDGRPCLDSSTLHALAVRLGREMLPTPEPPPAPVRHASSAVGAPGIPRSRQGNS